MLRPTRSISSTDEEWFSPLKIRIFIQVNNCQPYANISISIAPSQHAPYIPALER